MNGQALAYDRRGNLTGDGVWAFGYDGLDRLASARKAGVEAAYGYLPTGERAWKRVNGADTLYLTAGGQGLAELSGDGTLLRAFLPGPGGLAPAAVWEGGQWRYPLTDRRGSVLLVTDGGSTVLGRARFDAWGRGTPAPGSPFGFTGHRFDSETGLYATPTRHYSPALGRWLQLDPIGIKDGLNRYAYVGNRPTNGGDPTGQYFESFLDVAFIVYDVGALVYDEVANGGANRTENITALAADVAGLALPGATGLGIAARAADKAADVAQAAKTLCCFVAGTPVLTPDGLRPIEALRVGDLVMAWDEATGTVAAKPVTQTFRRDDREVWSLEVVARDGRRETFRTTDDHPWYVPTLGWLSTADLRPGMSVQVKGGGVASVWQVRAEGRVEPTYNIEVADYHTYFVGYLSIIVHNVGCKSAAKGVKSVSDAAAKLADDAGQNRVSARTAGGRQVDIDLKG